jgi:molybdopterin-biosynthesis enzyme MoeA-like protein
MADLPQGAGLIPNPVNNIPGFSMGHIHFVPGFPAMAWPMLEWVLQSDYSQYFGQVKQKSQSLLALQALEGDITDILLQIEKDFPKVNF